MTIDKKLLDDVALSEEEYKLIVARLDREPTPVELGMFGSLWSEHCGYQHSKLLLKMFPTTGDRVLTRIGEENAGAVDIGDGLAIVMKMESHNHPSAIEPYQGAATGVGGIVRDIFAMGARPIALLNSLRFGPLSQPRNRYLFSGVVAGIAGYGNCLGIPDIAGEVFFADAYSANPLINAMCVGIVETEMIVKAMAKGAGNLLMLVGADTGRDGLHGASGLASRTFEEDERELRPTVQVGNPFLEKLLMEACIQLANTNYIVGLQDLGAAGLTSASVECASKGGSGIDIDVLKVARREAGMTPYEIMLSESQERMLVVVRKGYEDKVRQIFDKWDLHSDIIGVVTDDGIARIREDGQVVAQAPVKLLTAPPLYRPKGVKPTWLAELQNYDLSSIPNISGKEEAESILLRLLGSPNVASKWWVYRQYDHQVQNNTVVPPGGDAALLRIKGTKKAIALTTDGNGRYCYLDPYQGGAMAVAEAARNVVCVGAQPIALTDCLNFGNPEKPEIFYQLEECIKGMAEACRILGTPVISGNVSLYNETSGVAVYPTPVVGMLGLMEDVDKRCGLAFRDDGDLVFLLGYDLKGVGVSDLAATEYLELIHGLVVGKPSIDLDLENRVQRCCISAIAESIVKSAHDCSEGGLGIALAECCLWGEKGFRGKLPSFLSRIDTALFGEAQSRIVVSVAPSDVVKLEALATEYDVPLILLGMVEGLKLQIDGLLDIPVASVNKAWEVGLEESLSGK